jgi:hypothetical protein
MPIGSLVLFILALAVNAPVAVGVKSVTPNGFEVMSTATIAAPADRVYVALGRSAADGAAPRIDRVLDEELQRLKSLVEGKIPDAIDPRSCDARLRWS